eukprot:3620392-Lingulodinium_polyedra.AAC.1
MIFERSPIWQTRGMWRRPLSCRPDPRSHSARSFHVERALAGDGVCEDQPTLGFFESRNTGFPRMWLQ